MTTSEEVTSIHAVKTVNSDVRPFEVKHDFDFCKLDGAETVNYDLERQIRRYSSSKLRNEKNAVKQEC